MDGAHLHLLINHVPVIVTPLGLAILGFGWLRRSSEILGLGLGVILLAALSAVPTYLTGGPAAAILEAQPAAPPDELVERHEDMAAQALAVVGLAGCAALAGLILAWRRRQAPRWLLGVTLLLSLAATVWLGVTANFGGQIRHPEVRSHAEGPPAPAQ